MVRFDEMIILLTIDVVQTFSDPRWEGPMGSFLFVRLFADPKTTLMGFPKLIQNWDYIHSYNISDFGFHSIILLLSNSAVHHRWAFHIWVSQI